MDRRHFVICESFADWSDDCQRQYIERFIETEEARLSEKAKQTAFAAYTAYHDAVQESELLPHYDLKERFWGAASEYFSMRVQDGDDWVSLRLYEKQEHSDKWKEVFDRIDSCENLADLGRFLRARPDLYRLLEDILEVRATSLAGLAKKIKARLEREKALEYDAEFGFENAYRSFGLQSALIHFDRMIPKGPGRKKRKSGPDAYRARAFWNILKATNTRLETCQFKETSWKELCEVTRGVGYEPSEYARAESVRWAYEMYFRAANTSVEGFLNSLSRGRRVLSQLGVELH